MGWAQLTNGDLLKEAEASFDALITTDQNLGYQQNLSGRPSGYSDPMDDEMAETSTTSRRDRQCD